MLHLFIDPRLILASPDRSPWQIAMETMARGGFKSAKQHYFSQALPSVSLGNYLQKCERIAGSNRFVENDSCLRVLWSHSWEHSHIIPMSTWVLICCLALFISSDVSISSIVLDISNVGINLDMTLMQIVAFPPLRQLGQSHNEVTV